MIARIVCTTTTGRHLQPGDLFSIEGPEYWDHAMDSHGIGQKVYVRTNEDAMIAADLDEPVFKIEVVREE